MGFYDKTGGPKNPGKSQQPNRGNEGALLNDKLAQTGRLQVFRTNPSLRNGKNAARPTTHHIGRDGRVFRGKGLNPKAIDDSQARVSDLSAVNSATQEIQPYSATAVRMMPGNGPGSRTGGAQDVARAVRINGNRVSHPAVGSRR